MSTEPNGKTAIRRLCGCALFLIPALSGLYADDRSWVEWLAEGQQLQAQGRYGEAESCFRSALEHAKASADPLGTARSMNSLALAKQILGDYLSAETLYQSATSIFGQYPSPLDSGAILLNRARLYKDQGKFDEAVSLCRRALKIQRAQLGPDDGSIADTLDALGWIELRLGRY